jgi:hypothetical protein
VRGKNNTMLEMSERLERKLGIRRHRYFPWLVCMCVIFFIWFVPVPETSGSSDMYSKQVLTSLRDMARAMSRQAEAQEKRTRQIEEAIGILRRECESHCKD